MFKESNVKDVREFSLQTILGALMNVRYGSAFLAVTWLSIAIGVAKSFDFWYIKTEGGSHIVMACTGGFGTLVQVVTFFALPRLNDRFGHLSFLTFALLITAIGCWVTAYIITPWWMLLPLCLRGVARSITTQSSGAYVANAVDKNGMATLQAIMTATTNGIGGGLGSLLGGLLISTWSPFVCYFSVAMVSFLFSIILLIISWCYDEREVLKTRK